MRLQKGDRLKLRMVHPDGHIDPIEVTDCEVVFIDHKDKEGAPIGILDIDMPARGMLWLRNDGTYTDEEGYRAEAYEVMRDGQPISFDR